MGRKLGEEAEAGRREGMPFSRRAKIPATQNLEMFLLEAERRKMSKSEKSGSLLGAPVNRHLRP